MNRWADGSVNSLRDVKLWKFFEPSNIFSNVLSWSNFSFGRRYPSIDTSWPWSAKEIVGRVYVYVRASHFSFELNPFVTRLMPKIFISFGNSVLIPARSKSSAVKTQGKISLGVAEVDQVE